MEKQNASKTITTIKTKTTTHTLGTCTGTGMEVSQWRVVICKIAGMTTQSCSMWRPQLLAPWLQLLLLVGSGRWEKPNQNSQSRTAQPSLDIVPPLPSLPSPDLAVPRLPGCDGGARKGIADLNKQINFVCGLVDPIQWWKCPQMIEENICISPGLILPFCTQ